MSHNDTELQEIGQIHDSKQENNKEKCSDSNFSKRQEQNKVMPIKSMKIYSQWPKLLNLTVRGKCILEYDHYCPLQGTIVERMDTFPIRLYDIGRNGGIKGVWQSILGYSKRELSIKQGYFYILESMKYGYNVIKYEQLSKLLKIFIDNDNNIFRLVFNYGQMNRNIYNFYSNQPQLIRDLFANQLLKIGFIIQQ